MKDKDVQISTFGTAICKLWGTASIAGNVIWVGRRIEIAIEHEQGKGGSSSYTEYRYKQSWAVCFCEGNANTKLMKLWFDGKCIYNITKDNESIVKKNVKWTFYPGSETAVPSSIIEREKGSGNVPGYRGYTYIVFDRPDITNWGNRLPNVRALIGNATYSPLNSIKAVPGYKYVDGYFDTYFSLQVLMSYDETYIVICRPDWQSGYPLYGTLLKKISTLTGQTISEKTFWSDECMENNVCNETEEPCTDTDQFGWHHPGALDEQGRFYAPGCDGYGYFYRLNSNSWLVEKKSPIWPKSNFTSKFPGWPYPDTYLIFKDCRVSQNPAFPYLWASCDSLEQGNNSMQPIALINRETMANPFDPSDWGHVFHAPVYESWG